MRGILLAMLPLLASAVAASAPVAPEPVPLDAQLKQAQQEAAAAAAEQQRLESAAANARSAADRLRLRETAAARAIDAAEARITAADAAVALIGGRLASQRQQLAREQAPAASLLGGLALMGRRPPLLLLADSKSPEQLVELRLLIDAVLPAIKAKTAALSTQLRSAERLRQQGIAARAEAQRTREDLKDRASELARLEAQTSRVAQATGSEALTAGDVAMARAETVRGLQSDAASIRAARAMAEELTAGGPAPERPVAPEGGASAKPPFRYSLPATGRVVEGFGAVSDSGIRSRGITLDTGRGAAVSAPAAGVVLFSGPFRTYDGVVILDHGHGWKSVLINVATTFPKGTKIAAGQRLGTALGPVEVELLQGGNPASPALIAGSSAMLSNKAKGG